MKLISSNSSTNSSEDLLLKERGKAEKAINDLKIVLDNMSAGLIYIDKDYVVQWESTNAIGTQFKNKTYIPGKVCYETVFSRDTPCEACALRETFETQQKTIHRHNEGDATAEISATPIFKEGSFVGGLLKIEDISDRVRQEKKLNDLNHVMESILNNIPVYLFVKDPANEFRYLYWNKAMAENTKIPASRVLGKTDFEIFPSKVDAERFRKDDLILLENQDKIEFQEEYLTAEGEMRTVNTVKALIPSENNTPWTIGFSWDITDLKKTEKELVIARDKAEQSNKLKSSFLANMSHEIRTPLNAIVGFSELLADVTDEVEKREYIEIIKNNNELLLQLISDILDLSKIEAQSLEFIYSDVNVNDMCETIVTISNKKEGARVPVVFGNHLPKCYIHSDKNRVSQVILNMVNNALKFTHSGCVTVGYDIVNDCEIEFHVQDTGTGISADKLGSIFDRFVKLDAFVQGTGLGLSICKSIVKQLKGTIGVKSEVGAGSCFWFRLPYNAEQSMDQSIEDDNKIIKTQTVNHIGRQTILIAEDVDANYMLLDSMLKKNYDLIRAHDGSEAVDMFMKTSPSLIIMDIKMPGMSGLEATRIIRKQDKEIPIIALTAFAYSADMKDIKEAGCNELISKHISTSILRNKIKEYLG